MYDVLLEVDDHLFDRIISSGNNHNLNIVAHNTFLIQETPYTINNLDFEPEENLTMNTRDELLEILMDAFAYGNDDYLESLDTHVDVEPVEELEASPAMRRRLIRLRNSAGYA